MLRFGVLIVILITLFSIGVSIIAVPPHVANVTHLRALIDAFGLGNCNQPCWHGIELGTTTISKARRILSADPAVVMFNSDDEGCQIEWNMTVESAMWTGKICQGETVPDTDPVQWIDFRADDHSNRSFTLLDATLLFVNPTGELCASMFPPRSPAYFFRTVVFNRKTYVGWSQELPYRGLLFDPAGPITWIRYDTGDADYYVGPNSWRGFTSERLNEKSSSERCPSELD